MNTRGDHGLKIIAFCCENSAYQALERLLAEGGCVPDGLHTIRVPCAGKVDELYVLRALEEGANGVLVVGCHTDSCRFLRGNIRVQARLERVKKLLEEIGCPPECTAYASVAPHMSSSFGEIVLEFIDGLDDADPGAAEGAVKS